MSNDKCKLCGDTDLKNSHILPKFIYKWMKSTGTGRLRHIENINVPKEDGIKLKFLCGNCEYKFNISETYFSKTFFYPFINKNEHKFSYNSHLKYFVISMMWRTLKHSLYVDVENTKWIPILQRIEKTWYEYLYNDIQLPNDQKIHCIAGVDTIKEEKNFSLYMGRATDAGIPNDDEKLCFLYVKIPRFIFFYPISGFDESNFINSEIKEEGKLELNTIEIKDPVIGNHFLYRSQFFKETQSKISLNQKNKSELLTDQKKEQLKNNDLGSIKDYLK
jgi:hypothetical protein